MDSESSWWVMQVVFSTFGGWGSLHSVMVSAFEGASTSLFFTLVHPTTWPCYAEAEDGYNSHYFVIVQREKPKNPLSVGGYPQYIHISGYIFQYEISIDMLAQLCFGPWVSCPIPGEHAREAGFVDHVPSIKVQGSVILIHLDMERWGLMDENRQPVWYLLYIQNCTETVRFYHNQLVQEFFYLSINRSSLFPRTNTYKHQQGKQAIVRLFGIMAWACSWIKPMVSFRFKYLTVNFVKNISFWEECLWFVSRGTI